MSCAIAATVDSCSFFRRTDSGLRYASKITGKHRTSCVSSGADCWSQWALQVLVYHEIENAFEMSYSRICSDHFARHRMKIHAKPKQLLLHSNFGHVRYSDVVHAFAY